jgi:hypothetical protein
MERVEIWLSFGRHVGNRAEVQGLDREAGDGIGTATDAER